MKTFLISVLWGLLAKAGKAFLDWWNNEQAIKAKDKEEQLAREKITEEVTNDIKQIIDTETREEQREALKRLTENIRNRMRS